jgi:hypothetical protein
LQPDGTSDCFRVAQNGFGTRSIGRIDENSATAALAWLDLHAARLPLPIARTARRALLLRQRQPATREAKGPKLEAIRTLPDARAYDRMVHEVADDDRALPARADVYAAMARRMARRRG